MDLWLFRHGEAHNVGERGISNDFNRFLTDKGRQRTEAMTRFLITKGFAPDQIWHSPLVRAQETAEIIASTSGVKRLQEEIALADDQSEDEMLTRLLPLCREQSIVLVGHQPLLGYLVSRLVYGKSEGGIPLKKSGVARISVGRYHACPCGELVWLVAPKLVLPSQ